MSCKERRSAMKKHILAPLIALTLLAPLAAGAEEVWLPVDGLAPIRSEGDLARLSGRTFSQTELFSLYAVHLFGGAAMGGAPSQGFCNVAGECFDLAGLSVVDASSLPGNTGANPQITIMANALRIAAGIAAAEATR